ncbi:hypothetical protein GGR54DRAFT_232835 [Hypoxylon sp. NC1633]|nr:hypothetical protein GGR54DRAFT_232835 [Hypoxylon sp. NC1633]
MSDSERSSATRIAIPHRNPPTPGDSMEGGPSTSSQAHLCSRLKGKSRRSDPSAPKDKTCSACQPSAAQGSPAQSFRVPLLSPAGFLPTWSTPSGSLSHHQDGRQISHSGDGGNNHPCQVMPQHHSSGGTGLSASEHPVSQQGARGFPPCEHTHPAASYNDTRNPSVPSSLLAHGDWVRIRSSSVKRAQTRDVEMDETDIRNGWDEVNWADYACSEASGESDEGFTILNNGTGDDRRPCHPKVHPLFAARYGRDSNWGCSGMADHDS